jgi:hypothetical protein
VSNELVNASEELEEKGRYMGFTFCKNSVRSYFSSLEGL